MALAKLNKNNSTICGSGLGLNLTDLWPGGQVTSVNLLLFLYRPMARGVTHNLKQEGLETAITCCKIAKINCHCCIAALWKKA